jgi:Pentapeptide repeats (9 copies)
MSSEKRNSAERVEITAIRKFFDDKTKFDREDKLSQAYISNNFTQSEIDNLNETIKKECGNQVHRDLDIVDVLFLYEAYCQENEFKPSLCLPKHWWNFCDKETRKAVLEWRKEKPEKTIRSRIVFDAIKKGLLWGIGLSIFGSFLDLPGREKEKYLQAWQVINLAKEGTGGRIEALEYLNGNMRLWSFLTPSHFFRAKCIKHKTCLVGINIKGANLSGINLEEANFESSNISYTSFRRAKMKNAKFQDNELEADVEADGGMNNVVFAYADLTKVDFTRLEMKSVKFRQSNLTDAKFNLATLDKISFEGSNLKNADFSQSKGKMKISEKDFPEDQVCATENTDKKNCNALTILCDTTMSDGSKSNRDCNKIEAWTKNWNKENKYP